MSTPKYTEASVEEALLILDNARDCSLYADDHALMMAINMAAQKLRGVQLSEDDAVAVELVKGTPMVVIASDTPGPKCSPLSCDGCAMREEGGNNE